MLQPDAVKPVALLAAGWMEVPSGREIRVVHLSDGHSLPPGTMQTHFFFFFLIRFYFIIFKIFIYLFLAVLGLRFCARAFSSCGERGHSLSRCAGLSLSRPLLLRSTGSRRAGSVIVAHGLSCSAAHGIFVDQGPNPCPLHWQADSQPLRHQGSPPLLLSHLGAAPPGFQCTFLLAEKLRRGMLVG